jgi:hypothetical protein
MRTFQAGDRVATHANRLGTVVSVEHTPCLRVSVWVLVKWDIPTYFDCPTSVPAYTVKHVS